MSFRASVNLGTVGYSITGQTVSISGCTDSSCTNCTSLVTGQEVTSFPKIITGIPDDTITLFVKVDGGNCAGTTQCITISGKPTPTPTPTSTPTPITPTPTPITPTPTPITPTPTPTSTTSCEFGVDVTLVTPTPTPTPTNICSEYEITTTTSASATFTDCNGQPATVGVGGVSGFDSARFCTSDFNSILTSGNVLSLTYIGDCMI